MSSMSRCASAPLRMRSRYSSVLESALVGLGREDAVILSARKKQRYDGSPARGLVKAVSAPQRRLQDAGGDDEDPFAGLKLLKSLKKQRKRQKAREELEMASPAVTRSASKLKQRQARCVTGVLEMAGHTPVTRSMTRRITQSSSLETIEDVEMRLGAEEKVNIQKKLVFPSPAPKKQKLIKAIHERRVGTRSMMCGKKRERSNRKTVILKHWWVHWPLKLKVGSEKVEIQISGLMDGTMMQFVLQKRQGAAQFTSSDGTYVVLQGKMDRDAARRASMPRAVVKLLEDGIPPFFSKRLRPFVQDGKKRQAKAPCELVKKRRKDVDKKSLSAPMVKKKANGKKKEAMTSFSRVNKDVVKTRKTSKQTYSSVKGSKKSCTKKVEATSESDAWTEEQVQALMDAKLIIPTTASNFWVQVAQYVPGKSAQECQAKTFEHFRSPPTNRKGVKKIIKRGDTDTKCAGSTKIARAGSNKFKKQVREFVEEYEKKHVDDVFETTPSKDGLPDLPEFGAIKSPELATPSHSVVDDDSDKEYETLGLLKKISSRRRDDIDSYVLGINRQHVAGGGKMVCGKVRRVTAMGTPSNLAKAKTAVTKNKAVMLKEDLGSCSMKAVISPGGTTQVRIDKDSSSSENEDDESSEEEANFDIL